MNILNDIYAYIKSGETKAEQLGLEIEHFIVDQDGNPISFDEITSLIEDTAGKIGAKLICTDGYTVGYSNDRYSLTLEPACQFEISINPYSQLSEIEKVYEEFLSIWEPLFYQRGYSLITAGNLPKVEIGDITPNDIPLSPKKRYQYMDAYFQNSGKYGSYMMRASASTQISVDYKTEKDLIRKLSVLQKISPVLMIIMENKVCRNSTLPGHPDKPHLLRIQEWDDLDPERTGFYPGSFDPNFGYKTIADVVYRTPLILLTDGDRTIRVGHKSARDLVEDHSILYEEMNDSRKQKLIEHFISMGFFHFRIKKYIEIRVADSVPLKKALGYTALIKGIVYSDVNLDTLERELVLVDNSQSIQDAVEKIEIDGLDAVIYQDKTAAWWKAYLIELAGRHLPEKEKEYLHYV